MGELCEERLGGIGRGVENGIGRGVENEIGRGVENEIGRGVENEIGRGVENEIGRGVENEIGRGVENGIGREVENEIERYGEWKRVEEAAVKRDQNVEDQCRSHPTSGTKRRATTNCARISQVGSFRVQPSPPSGYRTSGNILLTWQLRHVTRLSEPRRNTPAN